MFKSFITALVAGLAVLLPSAPATADTSALPAVYEFQQTWPVPPMYDQGDTNGCGVYSAATAFSALTEIYGPAHRFDAGALYSHFSPKHTDGVGTSDVLSYVQQNGITDRQGETWHVGSWWQGSTIGLVHGEPGPFTLRPDGTTPLVWDIDGVKRALQQDHVLIADLMVTTKFVNAVAPNPIDRGGKWDVPESGHAIAVLGWNRHGFVLQSTWGNFWPWSPHRRGALRNHWHSRWVVTYRYWRYYAQDVYGFTFEKGPAT